MSRKRYKPEQIVNLLRKIEVEIANREKAAQAAREVGICEQSYYISQYVRTDIGDLTNTRGSASRSEWSQAGKPGSDRNAGGRGAGTMHPGAPSLGQWPRIRGPGSTKVSMGSCGMNA